MALKKYYLMVDLKIEGKLTSIKLAEFDLQALEKYTSYCTGPSQLLEYMPDDIKKFLFKYLDRYLTIENDPFSIRTSASNRGKKIKIIYNNDIDVLLSGKRALTSNIVNNLRFSIDDFINGNVDNKSIEVLKKLYNYAGINFTKEVNEFLESKLNMDYGYNEKYEFAVKNRWSIIALSENCVKALVCDVMKDERKRVELAFLLKDNFGRLYQNLENEKDLINRLKDKLNSRRASVYFIRKDIEKNVEPYIEKTNTEKMNFLVCDALRDEYQKRHLGTLKFDKINSLNEKIEQIKLNLEVLKDKNKNMEKFTKMAFDESDIKKVLNIINLNNKIIKELNEKLDEAEFELYLLEKGNAFFSDAGFMVYDDEKNFK